MGTICGAAVAVGAGRRAAQSLESLIRGLGGLAVLPSAAVLDADGVLVAKVGRTRDSVTVLNPEFAADSDWGKGVGWTISDGRAKHALGTSSNLSQNCLALDRRFVLASNIVVASGGTGPRFYLGSGTFSDYITSLGVYNFEGTCLTNNTLQVRVLLTGEAEIDYLRCTCLSLPTVVPDVAAGTWATKTLAQATDAAKQWDSYTGTPASPGLRTIRGEAGDYSQITPAASVADWTVYLCLNVDSLASAQYPLGIDAGSSGVRVAITTGAVTFRAVDSYLSVSAGSLVAGTTAIVSVSKTGTSYSVRVGNAAPVTEILTDAPLSKLTLGATGTGGLGQGARYPGLIAVPYQAMGSAIDQAILRQFAQRCQVTL